ncbi:MAG TPA: PPC domain-containing DNA-binding protein [Vicinamibacterales bacterium]|nr:PPC domain-containing DNA-binding protein [Vicinamibacterales bacterium]
MNARELSHAGGAKTFVLVLNTGDEVTKELLAFSSSRGIAAASFTGIGAFQRVTLGYFEPQERDYLHIPITEQVEVLSLLGNLAIGDDGPKLHAHVVVGKRDGTAHGGHLIDAHVRPTLEVVLVETPAHLRRRSDPATGLALIDLKER